MVCVLEVVISAILEVTFEGFLPLPSRAIHAVSGRKLKLGSQVSFYGAMFTMAGVLSLLIRATIAQNQVSTSFPAELDGVYTGEGKNFRGTSLRGYPLRLDISGCDALYKTCGTMQYSLTEGLEPCSPEVGLLTFYGESKCQTKLGGRNPTGRCYMRNGESKSHWAQSHYNDIDMTRLCIIGHISRA
jgi:hypothetical protein